MKDYNHCLTIILLSFIRSNGATTRFKNAALLEQLEKAQEIKAELRKKTSILKETIKDAEETKPMCSKNSNEESHHMSKLEEEVTKRLCGS